MNQCPDCETPLAQSATNCRCGWTLPVIMPSVKTDVLERQIAEQTEQARASLAAKGLNRRPDESIEDWRRRTMAYVKDQIRGIGKAA